MQTFKTGLVHASSWLSLLATTMALILLAGTYVLKDAGKHSVWGEKSPQLVAILMVLTFGIAFGRALCMDISSDDADTHCKKLLAMIWLPAIISVGMVVIGQNYKDSLTSGQLLGLMAVPTVAYLGAMVVDLVWEP